MQHSTALWEGGAVGLESYDIYLTFINELRKVFDHLLQGLEVVSTPITPGIPFSS